LSQAGLRSAKISLAFEGEMGLACGTVGSSLKIAMHIVYKDGPHQKQEWTDLKGDFFDRLSESPCRIR
jgi:hypothetical protein